MKSALARHLLLVLCSALALIATLGLGACGAQQEAGSIRIGTMPTEDILPMWVAEQEGLFDEAGVKAEIVVFDSAQSLSAALTAGEVDIAMTDPMRAVKLCESGTDLTLEWITLGTTPDQGRFGVLTSADSGITSLADLANGTKGVGLAANTVPEYVFEQLCVQQGIDPASIPVSEVASLPDRYGLVASGQLDAAALPASMLALGQAIGHGRSYRIRHGRGGKNARRREDGMGSSRRSHQRRSREVSFAARRKGESQRAGRVDLRDERVSDGAYRER